MSQSSWQPNCLFGHLVRSFEDNSVTSKIGINCGDQTMSQLVADDQSAHRRVNGIRFISIAILSLLFVVAGANHLVSADVDLPVSRQFGNFPTAQYLALLTRISMWMDRSRRSWPRRSTASGFAESLVKTVASTPPAWRNCDASLYTQASSVGGRHSVLAWRTTCDGRSDERFDFAVVANSVA